MIPATLKYDLISLVKKHLLSNNPSLNIVIGYERLADVIIIDIINPDKNNNDYNLIAADIDEDIFNKYGINVILDTKGKWKKYNYKPIWKSNEDTKEVLQIPLEFQESITKLNPSYVGDAGIYNPITISVDAA